MFSSSPSSQQPNATATPVASTNDADDTLGRSISTADDLPHTDTNPSLPVSAAQLTPDMPGTTLTLSRSRGRSYSSHASSTPQSFSRSIPISAPTTPPQAGTPSVHVEITSPNGTRRITYDRIGTAPSSSSASTTPTFPSLAAMAAAPANLTSSYDPNVNESDVFTMVEDCLVNSLHTTPKHGSEASNPRTNDQDGAFEDDFEDDFDSRNPSAFTPPTLHSLDNPKPSSSPIADIPAAKNPGRQADRDRYVNASGEKIATSMPVKKRVAGHESSRANSHYGATDNSPTNSNTLAPIHTRPAEYDVEAAQPRHASRSVEILNADIDGMTTERAPLLRHGSGSASIFTSINDDPMPSSFRVSTIHAAVNPCAGYFSSVVKNIWLAGWTLFIILLAAAAAAPTALNALAQPSGLGPEELGKEWWDNMSHFERLHSIANGAASFLINGIMNVLFLQVAGQKIMSAAKCNRIGDGVKNTVATALGVGAAAAASTIAYDAFTWAGRLAIPAAALSATVTFAQRFVGAEIVMRRLSNIFNKDIKTQLELTDAIAHINKENSEKFEAAFALRVQQKFQYLTDTEKSTPLTNTQYHELLIMAATLLSRTDDSFRSADDNTLITESSTFEKMKSILGKSFDLVLALAVCAPASLLVHMEKGYRAVPIAFSLANKTVSIARPLQMLIGLDPGLASASLYANAGFEIRGTMLHVWNQLPGPYYLSAVGAGVLIGANVLAGSGVQNIGHGMVIQPNMFRILAGTPLGNLIILGITIGGTATNTNSTFIKAFPEEVFTPNTITLLGLLAHFNNSHSHPIDKHTGDALRRLSFFVNRRRDEQIKAVNAPPIEEGYVATP